jgi:hypothetical protein
MTEPIGRICLECRHCYVTPGRHGYSEYTPSTPFQILCDKGKKFESDFAIHEGSKESLLADIRKAASCPDFTEDRPETEGP